MKKYSRITKMIVGLAVGASSVLAMGTATPASAASSVAVGGTARCGVGFAAASVTIRLDSGGQVTVGTSNLPWQRGRFDMRFGWMPQQGTGYTAWVNCTMYTSRSGSGSWRGYLKPDWRNTTGTLNFAVS